LIRTCIFNVVDAAKLSATDCINLPSSEANLCLVHAALANVTKVEDCANIADANIKQICLNNFYANLPK
jgi:hypothetical protein